MTLAEDDWHRRKQTVELPGSGRMAFVDTGGSGPALLMLHGFSDTSRSFAMLEPLLSGYRLIIPDMPGHGGSELGKGTRISDFATSIVSLLNQLDVTPVAIVGHSMGAMTAIVIASRGDLRALILLSASLKPDFGSESSISGAIRSLHDPIDPSGTFLREWYACTVPVDPDFLMKMKIDAAAMPATVWHGILEGFACTDLTPNAVQIISPVLCIGGSSDPLFGLSHRQDLSGAFKSVRSVTLEGHGHNPHWEDPQLVAKHLLSFLSEIRGS
ncbi:pimeloyl-ACP methyl ester carboxylesterase [Rhizobium tibeticum]|uniref:alpha/beta fold hydrolase n=1 Tax=Rhizobium tibeticum TaxID=501024 RepID=UPI002786F825|nr:alpha/beta hydrolase [Rhizobium tibeticum]MDP9812569.1 pimeloyl-ACP methyl ester carboxylesterase [Rhizobium tibeticum]